MEEKNSNFINNTKKIKESVNHTTDITVQSRMVDQMFKNKRKLNSIKNRRK